MLESHSAREGRETSPSRGEPYSRVHADGRGSCSSGSPVLESLAVPPSAPRLLRAVMAVLVVAGVALLVSAVALGGTERPGGSRTALVHRGLLTAPAAV